MTRFRFISACLAALSVFGAQAARPDEKPWREVHIGTEGAYRPWNFSNPDGSLDGFEIELSKVLCAHMKVTCTFVVQSFDGMIPALNAGKFDAIMSGMSATPKRAEVIAFSMAYSETGQTFATEKGSPLESLPGTGEVYSLDKDEARAIKALDALRPVLQGKIIGVQGSTIGAAFLDKYLKGAVEVREYQTTEQHDLDLASGRVDLVTASMSYLKVAAAKPQNSDMVIVGPRFQGGLLGRGSSVGMRKTDPELKALFDDAIAEAKADGTIARLSNKWFGFDVTPR